MLSTGFYDGIETTCFLAVMIERKIEIKYQIAYNSLLLAM